MGQSRSETVAALRESFVFGAADDAALEELATATETVSLPGGRTLIRQGDTDDCLYILVQGRLRAFVEHPGMEPAVVGEIARGESVGEMALLTGGRRTATVRAARDSQLLRLSKSSFDRLIERSPRAAIQLARLLVNRLTQTLHTGRVTRAPASVAVLPATTKDAAEAQFARTLATTLAAVGRSLHLDARTVEATLGPDVAHADVDAPGNARIAGWLNELEAAHAFVVYEADAALTGWTRRCLRQADRVVVVARAGTDAHLADAEQAFWQVPPLERPDAELVLLHEAGAVSAGPAAPWLAEPRRFTLHHHVRIGVRTDVDRVGRLLAGRAVGVALGGGGARAFAHIGVIQALNEARIPIDIVGGTSMGAVMAAQVAAGWDTRTMLERTRRRFVKSGSLFDYTVPLMSLIAGQRFVRLLSAMFGTQRIEDLWLKYFCVSTNLTRARMVVHETGPLARWLCASISVPGLAPPVFQSGDLLVDGSLLDTVPANILRRHRRGPVIAVDVTAPVDLAVDPAYEQNPSTWDIVWNRLNPFATRRLPTIYRIILRSTMLSSEVERIRADADVYIHPPVEGFDLLDWKAIDRIVDLGYRAASDRLSEWMARPAADAPPH
jgi:predicted acylesterase/phospholipase RssA/CRP-like cAMP-binding protein